MVNPVITLLSGLGSRDASVSVAKAVLLRYAPGVTIVDISHSVQNDLQQAAYLLLSAYRHFPKGSIHAMPLEIFSGEPRMLLAEKDNHFFIAQDNGVLPLAFNGDMIVRLCFEFSAPFFFRDWIEKAGQVTDAICKDKTSAFKKYDVMVTPRLLPPSVMRDSIDCNILYVDRYENVILDITKRQFDELTNKRPFRIKMMRTDEITAVSRNYNDVPVGKPLCRFNDAGHLEIAFNHGKAATAFDLGADDETHRRYRQN